MAIFFITDKNKVKEKTREYSQHNRRNAAQQLMTIIEYKGETDQALRGDNQPGGKGASYAGKFDRTGSAAHHRGH